MFAVEKNIRIDRRLAGARSCGSLVLHADTLSNRYAGAAAAAKIPKGAGREWSTRKVPGSARVSRAGLGVSLKQAFYKVDNGEDAIANTRDACATQQAAAPKGSNFACAPSEPPW